SAGKLTATTPVTILKDATATGTPTLTAASVGDVNGDRRDDLLLVNATYGTDATRAVGRAYLLLGSSSTTTVVLDSPTPPPTARITAGQKPADFTWKTFGLAEPFALGDTNLDGYAEFGLTRNVTRAAAGSGSPDAVGAVVLGGSRAYTRSSSALGSPVAFTTP